MAAPRRVIELAFSEQELADLTRVSRSRTEPASRVERARILLSYRETPSLYSTGRAIGVTHQTVERCLRRAQKLGIMAALDDSPRPGREPTITDEARTFLVDLACRKPKELGYPHELWTTRLLTRHGREQGPAAGHACLAKLAQGTLGKILAAQEIKPHKVRYYLQRRDPEFSAKMAEVLCVYREVASKPFQRKGLHYASASRDRFSTLRAFEGDSIRDRQASETPRKVQPSDNELSCRDRWAADPTSGRRSLQDRCSNRNARA